MPYSSRHKILKMEMTMIKNRTILEYKVNERVYEFSCDPNSPLGEIYDALTHTLNFVLDKMKPINEKPKEEKEAAVEPPKAD